MRLLNLLGYCLFVSTCFNLVSAEIIVKDGLNNMTSLAGLNYKISPDLGETAGNNVFYTFQRFNLSEQESATFTGDHSIQNMIGRITNNEVSKIDGVINSDIPDANLYLINPAGFLFGKTATLNIQGSLDLLRLKIN